MKYLFSLFLLMNFLTQKQAAAQAQTVTAETKLNVSYGNNPAQVMDVYLPAGRSTASTKSVILIHGGGWNSGDKRDFQTYIETFQEKMPHYAVFNINYRLVSASSLFPEQEQDVKAAVDFIAAQAGEYRIDRNGLVLLGASAGAHLALLQAYKYKTPAIKAVIDFFGPSDLLAMYNQPWHPMIPFLLQTLTGTTPAANKSVYEGASPVFFITSQSPPTLILQGGRDNIVDPSQSKRLQNKLDSAGVINEAVIYPSERHGWRGANLADSFEKITAFLAKQVK